MSEGDTRTVNLCYPPHSVEIFVPFFKKKLKKEKEVRISQTEPSRISFTTFEVGKTDGGWFVPLETSSRTRLPSGEGGKNQLTSFPCHCRINDSNPIFSSSPPLTPSPPILLSLLVSFYPSPTAESLKGKQDICFACVLFHIHGNTASFVKV